MNASTAQSINNLPEYVNAIFRHFSETDVFTSRTYTEMIEHDHMLPSLATARKHHLVKIAEVEKFDITMYRFTPNYAYSYRRCLSYNDTFTKKQAEDLGMDIKEAIGVEIIEGTRYYYSLDMDGIKQVQEGTDKIKEFNELTAQIKELENQLKKLREKRNRL